MRLMISMVAAFAAVVSSSVAPAAASSLWSVGGPEGGSISVLTADPQHPTTIYAATGNGGIWKTTDGAAHWKPAFAGLPTFGGHFLTINAVAVDPTVSSRVYAATNRGLYKSDDGGASWTETGESVLQGFLNAIAIAPSSSSTVVVGSSNGVYVSTDAGVNWKASNSGLVDSQSQTPAVESIAINPSLSSSIIAGTSGAGTFLSTNGGQSWSKFGGTALDGVDVTGILVAPGDIASVYVLSPEIGILHLAPPSNAAGASIAPNDAEQDWKNLVDDNWVEFIEDVVCGGSPCFDVFALLLFSQPKPLSAISPAPFASQGATEILVGTSGRGIYHSLDGGATVSPINSGLPSSAISSIVGDPASLTRYAGSGVAGVAKTTDDAHWTSANTGLFASEVYAVAASKSSPSIVYAATGSSIFKSVDSGVSWSSLTSIGIDQQVFPALAVDPTNPSIVYTATDEKGVLKTTNGGSSWTPSNAGITTRGIDCFAFLPSSSQTIYAGTDSGIFKTTDGGAHWAAFGDTSAMSTVRSLAIDPANPQTMFAGTDDGIFRSTDGGGHWSDVSGGSNSFLETQIHQIAIDPAAHTRVYLATGNGVWKSTDGGATWTEIDGSIPSTFGRPDSPAIVIEPGSKIDVAAVGTQIGPGNGVYRSTDGGTTWTALDSGLTIGDVDALAVSSGSTPILYAGTIGGGVFRSPAAAPPPPPGKRKIIPSHPPIPREVRERLGG
ncbi:MAG TPA: hypothetical protein VFS34_10940 [Thermoanaerobaculia bacterium]|nr:hypothetical protein [Thermoanaerobaculia bacterium]